MGIDTIPTGIATGTAGSLTAAPVTTAVPAGGAVVLAAGVYALSAMGANTSYQVFDGAAWQAVVAAGGTAGLIYSDGTNYRFSNTALAAQNVTTQKIG